jgi:hypothetical protein
VAGQLAASFPVNQTAHEVHDVLAREPAWADVKARIASARSHAEAFWNEIDQPHVPSLEDVRRYAWKQLIYARLMEAASSPQSATTG